MNQLGMIAFSAIFISTVCLFTGRTLLRLLNLDLFRYEEDFLGFLTGGSLLSLVVFMLGTAGMARVEAFLGLGVVLLILGVAFGSHRASSKQFSPMPWRLRVLFGAPYIVFGILYIVNALVPEASSDGVAYHVALAARYLREHRLTPITTNMYALLSQGMEMLFLFAFSLGKHTAAAMVHFMYLMLLPVGMLSFARRQGTPLAGILAAHLVFLSPIVGRTGTVAYVDVALAAVLFGIFYLLAIYRKEPALPLTIPIGLLAGFAYAVKYTGFLAIPYALISVVFPWRGWRKPAIQPLLITVFCAGIMAVPWMARNYMIVNNPFAPFGNRLFRNQAVYVMSEETYSRAMRQFNEVSTVEIPLEVTVKGYRLLGLVGPFFC